MRPIILITFCLLISGCTVSRRLTIQDRMDILTLLSDMERTDSGRLHMNGDRVDNFESHFYRDMLESLKAEQKRQEK